MKKKPAVNPKSDHSNQLQDLLANNTIYKAIWDNSIYALFIGTPEGQTLAVNQTACRMFGYSEKELIKVGLETIIRHDDAFAKIIDERKDQGNTTGEITCIRKNGEHFICKLSSAFITENNRKVVTTTMEDISEQSKIEKLLDNTNRLAKVGGWELDIATNKIYWTAVTRQIHEVDEHFALTGEVMNQFYKDKNDIGLIKSAMAHGEPVDMEMQIVTAKGNERWIRMTAKPEYASNKLVKYYGSIQDITSIQLAEAELTKSRLEYKSIFDNSADAIFSLNPEGFIQHANQGALELFECSNQELIGKHLSQFAPPEARNGIADDLRIVMKGSSLQNLTRRIITAKGNIKIIIGILTPIKNNNRITGASAIARNITEQQHYQQELEFHSRLLNTIHQAVKVVDLDGQVIYWNNYSTKLYGWTREETLGKKIDTFDYRIMSEELTEEVRQKLLKGETWSGDLTVRNKDNSTFKAFVFDSPFKDEAGKIIGILTISFDNSKEIEARNHIQFQAKLLSTIQEAVMIFDLEYKITYWNDSATRLYGWTREEVIGKNMLEIVPPDLSSTDISELKEKAWSKEGWSGELTFCTKENKKIIAHVSHAPLLDEAKNVLGLISVTYDITKEVEARDYILFQAKLLDIVEQAVFCADLSGRVIYWNHHAEKLYGWKKDEIIGRQAQTITANYPSMAEERKAILTALEHGKSWSGEIIVQHKNGDFFPVFGMVSPTFDENQKPAGLISVTYDIRARKEQERQKEIERIDKDALINTTEDYIWSMDKDHKILAANHAFVEVLKFQTQKVFKRGDVLNLDNFIPNHYSDFFEDSFKRGLSGESFTSEYSSSIGNHWFELTVNPIFSKEEVLGVACFYKNITTRKIAEEQSRINNERYEFLAKATHDCIWDWNIQSNESQWAGSGMETLFGYTLQEVLANSKNFWNLRLHADDGERVRESLLDIFSDPEQHTWVCEYRFLKADGTYAHVYDKGYVIRNENNKPIRMIGAMQDISHRKEAELQLKNLNDKLEKKAHELQESNSELEQFAYVASHDLQEPLRMVTSFLTLLEERFKDNPDPKAHQYINFAIDGAKRMKQLIFDLLEYSRVGTAKDKLGETNMNEVMRSVLNVFKLKIEETKASITYSNLPVLPNTRHTQMNQLMQNLIENALKYNTSAKPEISIDVKEEDNHWLFSIKDNGIGFENQFSKKIFDIFQRLHGQSQYSGTGIGLSICKKIVERHGGKIWAESTEGFGSTFFFSFPKTTSE